MKSEEYHHIIVESFLPRNTSGKHGPVHIRPLPNQDPYRTNMYVACSKKLSYNYPVGTKFRIRAKINQVEGGADYVYSHYLWPYEVLGR